MTAIRDHARLDEVVARLVPLDAPEGPAAGPLPLHFERVDLHFARGLLLAAESDGAFDFVVTGARPPPAATTPSRWWHPGEAR